MQVVLPENSPAAHLRFDTPVALTEEDYLAFCQANRDLRIERTAQGEIVIVPPAGAESDYRSLGIASQLYVWAERDGRGKAFGSSVQFLLPNGAALSPDAAWVSNDKLATLTKDQRRKFLRLTPDFIAEVMSPSDRLSSAQAKMAEWIESGVSLAWLIDGDARIVYIYRLGQPMELSKGALTLTADGPLEGFKIQLADLWAGL